MKLLGSKERVGVNIVKVDTSNGIYGKVILFLDSFMLGSSDEYINLNAFISQLQRLERSSIRLPYLRQLTDEEAFMTILESKEEIYDQCILSLGESFDDFEIRFYDNESGIRVMWKMVSDPYFDYPFRIDSKIRGVLLTRNEISELNKLLIKEVNSFRR